MVFCFSPGLLDVSAFLSLLWPGELCFEDPVRMVIFSMTVPLGREYLVSGESCRVELVAAVGGCGAGIELFGFFEDVVLGRGGKSSFEKFAVVDDGDGDGGGCSWLNVDRFLHGEVVGGEIFLSKTVVPSMISSLIRLLTSLEFFFLMKLLASAEAPSFLKS